MSHKVIMIGMDGADPALALPWAAEGKLPNLARLIDRGSGGVLLSTHNAMSPAAWSSFATGLNPGRHGVFYFLDRKPRTYDLLHSGPLTRHGASFWRAMSEAGKRVAILHVPMTYPVEEVNGIQIAGWLAPQMKAPGYAHPPGLAAEIRREVPGFKVHTGMTEHIRRGRHAVALANKIRSVAERGKLARRLWQKDDWDCFVCVFDETDPITHYFWHFADPQHPWFDAGGAEQFGEAILDIYRAVDEQIGRLMELVPPDAYVFIMSDHGQRRNSRGPLYLKGFLRQTGLEAPAQSRTGGASKIASAIYGAAQRMLPSTLKHRAAGWFPNLATRLLHTSAAGDIDYSTSRAYTFWCNGCAEIWINLTGRDPQGIVAPGEECDALMADLAEALRAATDITTGAPLVEAVYRKDEIYEGPHLDRAPDMLIAWSDTVIQEGIELEFRGEKIVVTETAGEDLRAGNHRREGLLIASGPDVQAIPHGASIQDLAPTFLALTDTPAPGDLDGRVLTDLIPTLQAGLPTHEIPDADRKQAYSVEEQAAIEGRLKDLGYM